MKQIIHYPTFHASLNGPGHIGFWENGFASSETITSAPWSVTGSFSNLKITSTQAPGAGRSVTWTLMVNGVTQSLTVTMTHPATSATDVVNTVAVVPGDVVCFYRTNTGGTPTWTTNQGSINLEFDSADDHESGYNQANNDISFGIGGIPLYNPVGFGKATVQVRWNAANTTLNDSVIPLAGAITRADLCYRHGGLGFSNFADMVAGDSVEFVLLKNGIVQDGTSGTTDTRITFAYPATAASWTGSLAVAAGDLVKWRATPTNMIDDDGDPYGIYTSIRFYSTTPHRFWLSGYLYADETTTRYGPVATTTGVTGSNTETVNQGYGSINTWYMIAIMSTGEVGTAHWIIDGRLNSTSPVGAPSVGVLRTSPYGPLTEIFQVVAVGSAVSPGGSFMTITAADNWTLRFLPTVPARTCTVFGINTTIDGATRAVAFGLDNNTNVHTETGKAKVFGNFDVKGYLELQPMTAPAAGTAGARLYIDSADGDLKIIFANGQVRTIDVN